MSDVGRGFITIIILHRQFDNLQNICDVMSRYNNVLKFVLESFFGRMENTFGNGCAIETGRIRYSNFTRRDCELICNFYPS